MYKHARSDARFLTHGAQECDEPEELERRARLWAERQKSG